MTEIETVPTNPAFATRAQVFNPNLSPLPVRSSLPIETEAADDD